MSKSSLKPEWKRGSYRFKHFPLGFISLRTQRILPGLTELPGNLLATQMARQDDGTVRYTEYAKSQHAEGLFSICAALCHLF